jgi:tetratricopeptide (TPR) repeat protein
MAPEQVAGGTADARSDQFAFCLALYEALYGERPFAGEDLEALHRAMVAGEVRKPPAASRVPARVRRTVLRGLSADPARRHPDLRALLGELGRVERARGVRVAAAAIVMIALAIAGVAMRSGGTPPCSGAGEAWGDTWDDSARAAVKAAFARTRRPGAAFAYERIDHTLAAYRASWVSTERRVCEATRVEHVQSEALLAARMQCLDDRRRDAVALASVLASADAKVVDDFTTLLDGLGSVDACASARANDAEQPQGPAVAALRDRLAEAKALDEAGRYDRALTVARAAAGEAHRLGARALEAELLYRRGHLEREANTGDPEATLHAAASTALAARDDGAAADAWTYLSYLAGFDGGRRGEGERWSSYAAAAIDRLGGDDVREARRLHYLFVMIYSEDGKADEARALLDRARTLIERAGAPEPLVIINEGDRAALALQQGRLDDAYAAYRSARERDEHRLGPDNPGLGTALENEAVTLVLLGRPAEAVPIYQRVLALDVSIARSGNGEAFARFGLARALRALGRPAEALDEDRRAVAIYDQVQPPATWIGDALTGEGEDLLALARPGEALAPLERALALRSGPGADPEDRASTAFALARALWDAGGDRSRALSLARNARTVIAPLAARYGAYRADTLARLDRWLASASPGTGSGG